MKLMLTLSKILHNDPLLLTDSYLFNGMMELVTVPQYACTSVYEEVHNWIVYPTFHLRIVLSALTRSCISQLNDPELDDGDSGLHTANSVFNQHADNDINDISKMKTV